MIGVHPLYGRSAKESISQGHGSACREGSNWEKPANRRLFFPRPVGAASCKVADDTREDEAYSWQGVVRPGKSVNTWRDDIGFGSVESEKADTRDRRQRFRES